MEKTIPCPKCSRLFATENDLSQHKRWKGHGEPKSTYPKHNLYKKRDVDEELFTDMFDGLPDGAFFALAEEFGLDIEDFIEED
jgi:uncharacterized C2H2 Zn-finger protein